MWVITPLLIRRNLMILFSNKKFFISPKIGLCIERHCSKHSKNISNLTSLEKNFHEKDFMTKEIKSKDVNQRRITLTLLGISVTVIGAYILIELKNTDRENKDIWQSFFSKMLKNIESVTTFIQEPSREKLLPDPVSYPYFQPPYTLILEFTDVLAHPDWTYKTGWRFKKRPGLDYMLENLVGLYEIVVFTAEPGMTIFPVIEALDPKNLISYKLVRDSTHFVDGHHVKNLEKLNRDLNKVIVVDWNPKSVKFHPDNHLNVPRWKGDNDDTALLDLTSFLKTIANTEIEDVREVLRFYKQFDDPLKEFRMKQRELLENTENEPPPKLTPKSNSFFNFIV